MSSKSQIIVGLDIGTSNVSVVVAESADHTPRILGFGQAPSLGLRKGVVINIESTVESIGRAVAEAEANAGVEISSVFASIGGGHIRSFNSNGIIGIRHKEVTEHDVDRVIEAAKAVAIPPDREILHVLPQEFIIDNQDGIREPLGMSGVRLEARVHLITGGIASAQNVVKCANRCGLSVRDIVYGPLAAAEVAVTPEERELGTCLVDIGGGTTDLVVFHKGSVRHTAVLAIGGSHITGDIASGLRTPVLAAEEIKVKHGTVQVSGIKGDEIIEVASTGGRPSRALSRQVLAEIIQPRVEEIFAIAHREIVRAGCDEMIASGLILTGGGSRMPGMTEAAQNIFNLPVRIGNPGNTFGSSISTRVDLATALGLVVYGTKARGYARYHVQTHSFFSRVMRRVNEWFGDSEA